MWEAAKGVAIAYAVYFWVGCIIEEIYLYVMPMIL